MKRVLAFLAVFALGAVCAWLWLRPQAPAELPSSAEPRLAPNDEAHSVKVEIEGERPATAANRVTLASTRRPLLDGGHPDGGLGLDVVDGGAAAVSTTGPQPTNSPPSPAADGGSGKPPRSFATGNYVFAPTHGISGRVHWGGVIPPPVLVSAHMDECGTELPQQSVRVKGDLLADALVTLEPIDSQVAPDAGPPEAPARVTVHGCQLTPFVTLTRASELDLVNDQHFAIELEGYGGGVGFREYVPMLSVPVRASLGRPGSMTIRSRDLPWMHGYVVVASSPLVQLTGAAGTFSFSDLAPGRYRLTVSHLEPKAQYDTTLDLSRYPAADLDVTLR